MVAHRYICDFTLDAILTGDIQCHLVCAHARARNVQLLSNAILAACLQVAMGLWDFPNVLGSALSA